ncbi:hypothetical protein ACFLZM_06735 [Thermodesulfobacteriota bacterium]
MLRMILKNFYLFGSIVLLLMVISAEMAAQTKIDKYIASVAVSENMLFIGETIESILIFDMKKNVVVLKPSIYLKHGRDRAQISRLINDNGRILAVVIWDYGISRALFEISPEGNVKRIGLISHLCHQKSQISFNHLKLNKYIFFT